MTDMDVRDRWLEVQLTASYAEFTSASYRFSLLVHMACDGRDASVVVAHRPKPVAPVTIAERVVPVRQVDELVSLLRQLRFPGRDLDMQPSWALDAEWFASTVLRVRTLQDAAAANVGSVEIGPHGCTEGEDSEAVRQLLAQILRIADLAERDFWWMLTGVYGVNT